jgi:hypothetical protein
MKILKLFIFLLILSNLNAQKVKYDNGEIFVDKTHKFNFTESDNKETKSKLSKHDLTDIEGNLILSMIDTTYYFEQLPNEMEPREAYHAYVLSAPQLNLNEIMPYFPVFGYAKQRVMDLKKVGFFENETINKEMFYKFLEYQNPEYLKTLNEELNQTNTNRKTNYKLTEEKIGPLLERTPGEISVIINFKQNNGYLINDGNKLVGKFLVADPQSYKPSVLVYNSLNKEIAVGEIFTQPETINGLPKYKYFLKLHVYGQNNIDKNLKWFYENARSIGGQSSITEKLENIAKFLVNEGFL